MIEQNQKVYLRSENDVLKAYWKAKTEFEVVSIVGDIETDRYVTLKFGVDGDRFPHVVFESELVALNKLIV